MITIYVFKQLQYLILHLKNYLIIIRIFCLHTRHYLDRKVERVLSFFIGFVFLADRDRPENW